MSITSVAAADALSTGPSSSLGLTLAAGYVLVSWWKPILALLPFLGWGWVVTGTLDKHAQKFFLGREKWAAIHMVVATLALAAIVLFPVGAWWGFFVGWLIAIGLLAGDIAVFAQLANRDERVPDHAQLTLNFSKWAEARAAAKAGKQATSSSLKLIGPGKTLLPVPPKEAPEFQVRVAAEEIYIRGKELRASRLDIAPVNESAYGVSYLVDGVRQSAGEPMPAADALRIIDVYKSAAKLDLTDRRRKLSQEITITHEDLPAKVYITTRGGKTGVQLTLLINRSEAVNKKIAELGLLDSQLEAMNKLTESRGVVLLAAPSGNGRTTMLYAVMKMHDAYTSNVQTVEYEAEAALEGVRQVIFNQGEDHDYATTVRSILRRDPDVVGVAELPDVNTAKEVSKADLERARVYLSLKADGALQALQIYAKSVADPKSVASGLEGVVACKLMRQLCENCRVPFQPPADMLKKLGLPADKVKQLYKKGGQVLIRNKPEVCPVCGGAGYFGQTGAFEVFPIDAEGKAAIAAGDLNALRAAIRKSRQPTIQQAALRKAIDGTTSIDEVLRVTTPKQQPAKKA